MASKKVTTVPRQRLGASTFSAINAHVGMRLRMRREVLQLEPSELAKALQMSEVDVNAFEAGEREFDVRALFRIAATLEVPLAWFHDGLSLEAILPLDTVRGEATSSANVVPNILREKEARSMLDLYFHELDADGQMRLVDVARHLARK